MGVMGHTGRGNYGHGLDTVWLRTPNTFLAAVSDPDEKGRAAAVKRLSAPESFPDHRIMLERVRPHIAAICPRHADQHHQMLMDAMNAGVRGIYIEKPFLRSPAEADEVVALAEKTRTRIAIAHRNRYHPVLAKLLESVKSGVFGRLIEIRSRGKEDHRGGAQDLWVLGSHVLNLAAFFCGIPTACSAAVLREGRPVTRDDIQEGDEGLGPLAGDEIHARFSTPSGVPLFFDSIKSHGNKSTGFGLHLICTEAVIDLRMDAEPLVHVLRGSPFSPTAFPRSWIPMSSAGLGEPEPLKDINQLVAGHLLPVRNLMSCMETGEEPECGAKEGAATIEMICAIFESHRRGGATVPIPTPNRFNPLSQL